MSVILKFFRGLMTRIFPTSNQSSSEPLNISEPFQEEQQDPECRLAMSNSYSEINRLSKIEKKEKMENELGKVKKLRLYFEEQIRQITAGNLPFVKHSPAPRKSLKTVDFSSDSESGDRNGEGSQLIPIMETMAETYSKEETQLIPKFDNSENSSGKRRKQDSDPIRDLIEIEDIIDKANLIQIEDVNYHKADLIEFNVEPNISESFDTKAETPVQNVNENETKSIFKEEDELQKLPVVESEPKLQLKKLPKIVQELIENEKKYVETLHEGIKNYVTIFNESQEMIPRELRGLKYHLFNNIENIYAFHKEILLPNLLEVGNDLVKIAETFTENVKNNYFYCYVLYAINKKHSDELCRKHNKFFNDLKGKCNDMLGVSSFTLQPIQRVPRYQLLMNEIAKELTKDVLNHKDEISKVCVAEKSIQRLLNSVNEALSIHDITICKEVDIFCQGQFKKMSEFNITDARQKRKYKGKVFFFQQKIIYAESKDGKLEYCGYFDCDDVAIVYSTKITKFKLCCNRLNNVSINLHSDPATIVEWLSLLEQVLSDNIDKISNDNSPEVFSYSDLNIPASLAESKVRTIEEPEMELVKGTFEKRTIFYT